MGFDVRTQIDRATRGQAAGQCRGCGAWTTDGRPPTLHTDRCTTADTIPLSPDRVRRAHEAALLARTLLCGSRVQVSGPDGVETLTCRLDYGCREHEAVDAQGEVVRWRDTTDAYTAADRAPRPVVARSSVVLR